MHGTAPQQQPQSKREAILAAAEDVFAEAGYEGARLDDIARRVGIRRPSVLYHFHDKAALYEAVLASMISDLDQRYRRVLETPEAPGPRIERTVDEWLEFIEERPAYLRILLREVAAGGVSARSRPFAELIQPTVRLFVDVISEGQVGQVLRQVNALHTLMAIGGASALLTLGGPLVTTADSSAQFPTIIDRQEHRALLLAMFRKLLGTHGLRLVNDESNL